MAFEIICKREQIRIFFFKLLNYAVTFLTVNSLQIKFYQRLLPNKRDRRRERFKQFNLKAFSSTTVSL